MAKTKGSILSTEAQARKVLDEIQGKPKVPEPKPSGIQQGDQTAKSPPGLQKSKARGQQELARLRAKRKNKK